MAFQQSEKKGDDIVIDKIMGANDNESATEIDDSDEPQPTWVYNQLSWYLSWMWGQTRSRAQPLISNKYSADLVYSEKIHGTSDASSESNFEIHLGGLPSLFNEKRLTQTGITHILTAVLGIGEKYSKDKFTTLNIAVRDVAWEKLCEYFDRAADFIKECENANGKIFVHCMCGVSRSSTLVAAYLIREKGMSAHDAIEHLHSYRKKVDPNEGFRQQLEIYALKNVERN